MTQRGKLKCGFVESAANSTGNGRQRATLPAHLLAGVLVACTVAGCSSDGASSSSDSSGLSSNPPSSSPISAQPALSEGKHGRFIGRVTIGGADYYGDALLTADGELRLYVADPYVDNGVLPSAKPASSAQLVGTVDMGSIIPSGTGVVIGQHCTAAGPSRFCGEAAVAEISLTSITGAGWDKRLGGEIRVITNHAAETWRLELSAWVNYYDSPANVQSIAALWDEQLAEFTSDGDTVVRIDSSARLFFQSARTGCTGNGTLAAHLDGKFGVYDVSLNIGSCNPAYASLNGDFEGLASSSASSVWSYDDVLRMWLSTREGTRPVAVTMLAYRQY